MGPSERLRDYCREVSGYIRWKRIRPSVEAEIGDHLQDQRDAYMAAGDDEETAARWGTRPWWAGPWTGPTGPGPSGSWPG